jgi:hypothetical protein
MKMHELDTTNWNAYPFTVNGINYVSKVKPESDMAKRISRVPAQIFISMNEDCVRQLIGNLTSHSSLIAKLYEVNENASEAVIEIV